MVLQSSFFDPVLGLDTHIVGVPAPPAPAPVPTPIPMPFVGMVFDPLGLALGAAIGMATGGGPGIVLVNSMPVTNCGTEVTNKLTMPHIPAPGVTFIPPPMPGNDAELYFGSYGVTLGGSYGVRLGDIALSCNDPVRLPTSVVLAIPKGAPVLNMPAMCPDLMAIAMALAMKAAMRGLRALVRRGAALFRRLRANSRFFARLSRALGGCDPPANASRWRQMWSRGVRTLTGHPVDVVTGNLFTEAIDARMPGPLALTLTRVYESAGSAKASALGYGWNHSLDESVWHERGRMVVRCGDGREIEFPLWALPERKMRVGDVLTRVIHRMTLRCTAPDEFEVTQPSGNVHVYGSVPGAPAGLLRLRSIRSRDRSCVIELVYDARGRIEWVRDSGGRLIGFDHDAHDRLVALRLPLPAGGGWYEHRKYVYDDRGDLVAVHDSSGASYRYAYQGHLLVEETDRAGLSYYFQYDTVGSQARCVRTWGSGGLHDHVIDYDVNGRKTFVADSLGHATVYAYNERNQVVSITDPVGATTRFEWDPATGGMTLEEDPVGGRRTKRYDARGNLVEQTAPDGAALHIEYDRDDQPVRARDSRGGEWTWRYDRGRLVQRTLPTGERSVVEWKDGLVVAVRNNAQGAKSFVYDAHKNLRAVQLTNGAKTQYDVDALGRIVKITNPRGGVTRLRYDLEGRVVECRSPTSTVQRLAHDAEGNLLEFHDPTRHVRYEYGANHKVVVREEAGTRLRFEYDTEARLVAVLDEAQQRYSFALDGLGRVIAETGFDGRTRHYTRDAAGRVVRLTQASGNESTLVYDVAGRLVEVEHSDGSFARYAYGVDGTIVRAENESASVELERDALGRIVWEKTGDHEVRSRFDSTGLRDEVTSSLGLRVAIARDPFGDVRELFFDAARARRGDVRYERNELGLKAACRFANGIDVEWQHDASGRPEARRSYRHVAAAAALGAVLGGVPSPADAAPHRQAIDARTYEWRGEDQIAAIVQSTGGRRELEHDGRGRLIRERRADGIVERAMDIVGNVYKAPDGSDRHYDPGGRLVAADGVRYEHDEDGNRIRKIERDGSTWQYRWNGHGMLRELERPDGSRVEFEYDAFARRIGKRVIPADGGVQKETRFVWDRNVVVHELDRDVDVVTWHWDPDGFELLARDQAGRRHYVVSDHLGTPTEMYDQSGELAWRMEIDAAGVRHEMLDGAAAAVECPFAWPGQHDDPETGLRFNRFRYYDPDTDRYLSPDPFGVAAGTALYAYVPDSTTSFDPLGLAPYDFATLLNEAQNTLDFSTARDGAVFWSGPRMADAQAWAARNGKTTLEQTTGGRHLDSLKLFDPSSGLTGAQAAQIWDAASIRFAQGASGDVNVFSTGATRIGAHGERTWWRVERPALEANPDVTSITRRRIDGNPCG